MSLAVYETNMSDVLNYSLSLCYEVVLFQCFNVCPAVKLMYDTGYGSLILFSLTCLIERS